MKQRGLSIANLVCGNSDSQYNHSDELNQILRILYEKLVFFTNKLLGCNFDTYESRAFVPFYARSVLETTATALLSRVDPFRVITTYYVQNDASYERTSPSNIAINWKKDILAETAPPTRGLWHFDNKMTDYNRALLSKHQGEIIWKPAFLQTTDYLTTQKKQTEWCAELTSYDEIEFFGRSYSMAKNLFSAFSKGVHSESLVDVKNLYDEITLKTLSLDLLKWCCDLGLVSHFSSYALASYSPKYAVSQFLQAER